MLILLVCACPVYHCVICVYAIRSSDRNFPINTYLLTDGYVSAECVVKCTDFAARHCLSFILMALSSHSNDTRRVAYHCLRLYYDHIDAAVTQHHHAVPSMLLYLLDCVRYGIDESNARLPCIITTFLARAAHLLTTPGIVFLSDYSLL